MFVVSLDTPLIVGRMPIQSGTDMSNFDQNFCQTFQSIQFPLVYYSFSPF
jgi:hypothetical protein